MYLRTFLLFEELDKSNGIAFKNPFSLIEFDAFPTRNVPYVIALSFEGYQPRNYAIRMNLTDPRGQVVGEWQTFTFKPSPTKEGRGILYRHVMSFAMPGTYYYNLFVDDEKIGSYSLVVKTQERR